MKNKVGQLHAQFYNDISARLQAHREWEYEAYKEVEAGLHAMYVAFEEEMAELGIVRSSDGYRLFRDDFKVEKLQPQFKDKMLVAAPKGRRHSGQGTLAIPKNKQLINNCLVI